MTPICGAYGLTTVTNFSIGKRHEPKIPYLHGAPMISISFFLFFFLLLFFFPISFFFRPTSGPPRPLPVPWTLGGGCVLCRPSHGLVPVHNLGYEGITF